MIKEAYVSYETAKLLKEKGFNAFLPFGFNSTSHTKEPRKFIEDDGRGGYYDNKEDWISCPTHQMACAWLREVHNMHIDIDPSEGDWHPCVIELETWSAISDGNLGICDTYEDAVEAALKYALENLI